MNLLTLQSLPRNKLQKLAKDKGVLAVGKNADIIKRILEIEAQSAVSSKPPPPSALPQSEAKATQEDKTGSSTFLVKQKTTSAATIGLDLAQGRESNAATAGPSTTSMDGGSIIPANWLGASVAAPRNLTVRQARVLSQRSGAFGGSSAGAMVRMHSGGPPVISRTAEAPGEGSSIRTASFLQDGPGDIGSVALEEINTPDHARAAPLRRYSTGVAMDTNTSGVLEKNHQQPQDEPGYHPVFSHPLPGDLLCQHDQTDDLPPRSPVFHPLPMQDAQPVRRVPTELELVGAERSSPPEQRDPETNGYHLAAPQDTRDDPSEERGPYPAPMPREANFPVGRPTIEELQDKLYRLQPLVRQQSKTEQEIKRLLMLLDMAQKKEQWTEQKIQEIQMMRMILEEYYMGKMKNDRSLVGEGQRWTRPDISQEQDDSLMEGLWMNREHDANLADPDDFLSAPVR